MEHYPSGDHYTAHYTDSGLIIKAANTQYMYDGEGRMTRTFDTVNGRAELYAHDPYGNRIGYFGTSCWINCRYILPYVYTRLKDGSVKADPKSRVYVDTYGEWRDKLPTNFEPEPYKEPEKKKVHKANPFDGWATMGYDGRFLDSSYLSEVHERLRREQSEVRLNTDYRPAPLYSVTRNPSYDEPIRYVPRGNNSFDML